MVYIFTSLSHVEHDVLHDNDNKIDKCGKVTESTHCAKYKGGGLPLPRLAPKRTGLRPVCPVACASARLVAAAHEVVGATNVHWLALDASRSDEREPVRQDLGDGASQLQADVEARLHG